MFFHLQSFKIGKMSKNNAFSSDEKQEIVQKVASGMCVYVTLHEKLIEILGLSVKQSKT